MSGVAGRFELACCAAAAALTLAALLCLAAPPDPPHPSGAARSPGCGRPARTGIVTLSTEDGNHTPRSFRVQIPVDYARSRAYPVTFVFHAAGGSADDSYSWGLQDAPGAAAGSLFVYPTGIDFQHEGPGWDDRSNGYDFPFFDHMLAQLEAAYCIDPRAVFATGFSWGADFSIALACNRGGVLRAVAADSASDDFKDPGDYRSYVDMPCPGPAHPAVRFVHAEGGDDKYPPPDFATTSQLLQHLNSCSAAPPPVVAPGTVMTCRSYPGCATEYVECAFDHRIGHALPPHWAAETWAFFAGHSR
jgi:poly(3-hydroxybutyrate) depolymerase